MNPWRWFRQRVRQKKKPRRWNTCLVDNCNENTDHPDGPFCRDHGWKDWVG